MYQEIELKDLIGEHILTGVGEVKAEDETYFFVLDEKTYFVRVDPEDNRCLINNVYLTNEHEEFIFEDFFPAQEVRVEHNELDEYDHDVVTMFSKNTGLVVFQFGTNCADWYPEVIFELSPENFDVNLGNN